MIDDRSTRRRARSGIRRCVRPTLVSVMACSLSGCVIPSHFVVVNGSRAPIAITYATSQSDEQPKCPALTSNYPRVVPARDVDVLASNHNEEAPIAQYRCDERTGTVTLSLAPGHAVWLFEIGHYLGPEDEPDPVAARSVLTISGARGALHYTGRQTLRDFVEVGRELWVLRYQ